MIELDTSIGKRLDPGFPHCRMDASQWPTHKLKARRARRTVKRVDEVEPEPWWLHTDEAGRPLPVRKARSCDQLGA